MIFYLRCAAYLRLLPRTRTQKQRAQTHSRRRAMLATVTKINLPSCLGFCFQICPIYLMAPICHACISVMQHFLARADLQNDLYDEIERNSNNTPPLTLKKRTAKSLLPTAKNSKTVQFSVDNNSIAVLFLHYQGQAALRWLSFYLWLRI